MTFSPVDRVLLTMVAWQEARGEPALGMRAVAHVVLNRAKAWKKSVGEIILAKYQFSGMNTRAGIVQALLAERQYPRSWAKVAEQVELVVNGFAPNPIGEAKFYLNVRLTKRLRNGILPRWAADPKDPRKINRKKVVRIIGHHHFLDLDP